MTVGRSVALLVCLAVWPSGRPAAQVSIHLAAGARYTSTLVHDSIVGPVDLRPAVAPAFLLTVRSELKPNWSVDGTIDLAPTGLRRREGGSAFDAGSVTTVAFSVGLRRALLTSVAARVGVGGLVYRGEQTGVFRQGSGGLFPNGSVALSFAPSFGARRRLEIEARYDVHRFITQALRTEGFTDPRTVHRIAILARVGWGGTP